MCMFEYFAFSLEIFVAYPNRWGHDVFGGRLELMKLKTKVRIGWLEVL